MQTYLVRIAFLYFEVNTEVETEKGASGEVLLELALKKLEENGFSCSQKIPTVNDIEYEEY